ncbi:lysophosphatidylserine lipase ABHD12 isoform X3 [Diprion similis]|uniref:lysophosphatidylserine lipase ABHD12 isoform X3 n=1 Tax=Diprion similis TaxID=362088 RepID=UPI001EF8A82A|nr:lysophosphatidylserine lipase ABHD12 isoform X3 [Diprion similis]XP_046752254.1 lysophosphatidylserine lipase ABHD12 isoform X3 [Diprion similis]
MVYWLPKRRFIKRCLLWAMKVSIVTYLIVFGILPLVFHYSYTIQRKILFLNFDILVDSVYWPRSVDFEKPEAVGLEGARNFYVKTDQDVNIGAWQILPRSLLNASISRTSEAFESVLASSKRPVILYMHGNSGNRASGHRLELYRLFQSLDYHVICFDYRSYGDSDDVDLSETGVVADSKYMLEWLIKKVKNSAPIYVWGHSLGTGVASHVLALMAAEGVHIAGLFLEAPFNNIADELSEHPFAQLFKHLPWFHWMIVQPFYDNELRFESDKHITKIECPIMILHAQDDGVIPFFLGEKLYKAALESHGNETQRVQMERIDAALGLGHKWICRYEKLPELITNFLAKSTKTTQAL